MTTKPHVLKYPGGKWQMAEAIVANLPRHDVYLEPFFGSGAVFFTKAPSKVETINDIDGRIVNLFRVIREHGDELAFVVGATPYARAELETARAHDDGTPVEQARRFLVWCHQQIGVRTGNEYANGWRWTKDRDSSAVPRWRELPAAITAAAERLRMAQIESRPALDVIAVHNAEHVLIYADPPYEPTTLAHVPYRHVMTTDEHATLLDALQAHRGAVVLSGYRCDLYDERLQSWQRIDRRIYADAANVRVESLWLNPRAARTRQTMLPLTA